MSSLPRKRILGPPIQPQVEENSVLCKPLMPFRSRLPQSECQPGSVQRELSSHLHYFPKRGSRLVPGSRFPIHGIAAIFSNHVCIRTTASIRVSVCRAGRFTRVHSFSPRSEPQEVAVLGSSGKLGNVSADPAAPSGFGLVFPCCSRNGACGFMARDQNSWPLRLSTQPHLSNLADQQP